MQQQYSKNSIKYSNNLLKISETNYIKDKHHLSKIVHDLIYSQNFKNIFKLLLKCHFLIPTTIR